MRSRDSYLRLFLLVVSSLSFVLFPPIGICGLAPADEQRTESASSVLPNQPDGSIVVVTSEKDPAREVLIKQLRSEIVAIRATFDSLLEEPNESLEKLDPRFASGDERKAINDKRIDVLKEINGLKRKKLQAVSSLSNELEEVRTKPDSLDKFKLHEVALGKLSYAEAIIDNIVRIAASSECDPSLILKLDSEAKIVLGEVTDEAKSSIALIHWREFRLRHTLSAVRIAPPKTFAEKPQSDTVTSPPTPSTGKTVHVKGYYRKDGTYVRPHMRRPPQRRP